MIEPRPAPTDAAPARPLPQRMDQLISGLKEKRAETGAVFFGHGPNTTAIFPEVVEGKDEDERINVTVTEGGVFGISIKDSSKGFHPEAMALKAILESAKDVDVVIGGLGAPDGYNPSSAVVGSDFLNLGDAKRSDRRLLIGREGRNDIQGFSSKLKLVNVDQEIINKAFEFNRQKAVETNSSAADETSLQAADTILKKLGLE